MYPVISQYPSVQNFYEKMRDNGESHSIAEMLAFRQPPGGQTDASYFEGTGMLAKQFEGQDLALSRLVKNCRAQGIPINANSRYEPGLARKAMDPEALVGPTDGRGHIKRLLEKRGWGANGAVNVNARQDEPKRTKLAPDLVEANVNKMIAADPTKARVDRRELRAEAILKHGSKK
jgi:hypothetical protein